MQTLNLSLLWHLTYSQKDEATCHYFLLANIASFKFSCLWIFNITTFLCNLQLKLWNVHGSTTIASHTSHRYCIVTSQDGTLTWLNVSNSKHITQIFEVDSRHLDPRSFQFTNTLVQLGWCGYMLGWCKDDGDGDGMMARHGQ